MTDEEYIGIIKERLTEKRFNHSLEVAKSARYLAEKYGADKEKAYTAGLLHDIFKDTPTDKQFAYIALNNIPLIKCEVNAPKLFHAICGAHYIEHTLGIKDKDIIDAVRYHTTGKENMTLFQKVLFIADFISADRDYDGIEIMREKADISLDEAIFEGLSFTIKDLISMGRAVHPDTIHAYNDAAILLKKERTITV